MNYTGISFPFRVGITGGIVTSTTSRESNTHINEAIEQIVNTRPYERGMEYDFFSDINSTIFEPNDVGTKTLIEYEIKNALLKLEDRIEVSTVNVYSDNNILYADISYKSLSYNNDDNLTLKVGEI